MKKIVAMFLLVIMMVSIPIRALADDVEEEMEGIEEDILHVSTSVDNLPTIQSRACVIFDRDSKRVLYEKNAYSKRPMASTTKIMTAMIVLENAKLTDTVAISKKAGGTGGSRLGLKAGDKITVKDLLYGLMMRSRK